MSVAGVSVARLASVLALVVLCSLAGPPPPGLPGGRACLGGPAGRGGDGVSPPTAASICLLLSGRGNTRTGAAVAPAHGGEAGVRVTAPAASTPVTAAGPASCHW